MRWTRLSFLYLMSYLILGGIGLLAAPSTAIHLLGSSADYPPVILRLSGALMLGLGLMIADIARRDIAILYPSTLIVRTMLLAAILALYVSSRDPMFLVLAAIVALGMALTGAGLVWDRHGRVPAPK
jgi:uncharacterized protein YjeT (DUF2065 family)